MIYSVLVGVDYGGVVVFCFGGAQERLTWKCRDSVPPPQTYRDNTNPCGCLMIDTYLDSLGVVDLGFVTVTRRLRTAGF